MLTDVVPFWTQRAYSTPHRRPQPAVRKSFLQPARHYATVGNFFCQNSAANIHLDINQPPKMSPLALVSAGMAKYVKQDRPEGRYVL